MLAAGRQRQPLPRYDLRRREEGSEGRGGKTHFPVTCQNSVWKRMPAPGGIYSPSVPAALAARLRADVPVGAPVSICLTLVKWIPMASAIAR